ncbi:MAG: PAS domain S-box protein [Acidobacteria bacterium]|nr:PAS domain S-box protein [Acidobacteriota bacterium]
MTTQNDGDKTNRELEDLVRSRTADLERANMALFEEVVQHENTIKLQQALFYINEEASRAEDLEAFYPVVHQIVQGLMHATNFFIALYEPQTDLLTFPYFRDVIDSPPPSRHPGRGLTEYVLRTRAPHLILREELDRLDRDGVTLNAYGTSPACWLGVPLALGERFFGVMAVQSYDAEHLYTEQDMDVLVFVARQVSTAIERLALEAMRRRYEFIVNTAQEYMSLVDRQYRYVAVNDAYCRARRHAREEVLGRTVSEIWGEDRFKRFMKQNFDTCFSGQVVNYLSRFSFDEGEERCMDVTYYPFRNPAGEVTHAAVVSRDVTVQVHAQEELRKAKEELEVRVEERTAELKRVIGQLRKEINERQLAERALKRKEEYFRALIENAQDTIAILDDQGTITFQSPSILPMLGYAPEELVGRNAFGYIHPDDRPLMLKAFEESKYLSGRTTKVEFRWLHRDGAWRHIEAIGSNLRDNPDIGGIVIHSRDITERKQAEEALLRSNEKLKELDQVKTVFLSTVSHELRTPLTSILGFGKIIRRKLSEAEGARDGDTPSRSDRVLTQVAENVGIIVAEAERLTSLVNDVLDITRMESGMLEWKRLPVHIPDLVAQAAAATAAMAENREIAIRTEFPPDLPEFNGDPDRLHQVLVNLLSNALKFTEKGTVTVSARREGNDLLVSVADTGIGIDPTFHERIFDKFRQVGDTLTGKPEGTGLGLPICRQIVEHYGGRIRVESTPGTGSIFSFTLPLSP